MPTPCPTTSQGDPLGSHPELLDAALHLPALDAQAAGAQSAAEDLVSTARGIEGMSAQ